MHKFRQNRALLKLRRMLWEIKMSLGFENLFCLQIQVCFDSFILKVTVRPYLFCFGLKITICLVWRLCNAISRKNHLGLLFFFSNLCSINFRLTHFYRVFINYFIFPQHENGNLLLTWQLISSLAGLDSVWRTSSTSFQRAWCYLLFQCEQAI